jgi:hypothetical protein
MDIRNKRSVHCYPYDGFMGETDADMALVLSKYGKMCKSNASGGLKKNESR